MANGVSCVADKDVDSEKEGEREFVSKTMHYIREGEKERDRKKESKRKGNAKFQCKIPMQNRNAKLQGKIARQNRPFESYV